MASSVEDGTWGHIKARGLWHFDARAADPPFAHRVIATIDGDLQRLIDELPAGDAKTLDTSMIHRSTGSSPYDRIQAGNVADARQLGLDPALTYANVFDNKQRPLESQGLLVNRLVQQLALDGAYWKVHHQLPGQLWPIHFDNYHAFERSASDVEEWVDPGVRRLWIMLTDWAWGQFVQVGNEVWSHWSAGDVLYFDWLVPHGSANCGHSTRSSLLVTGLATDELSSWVASTAVRTIQLR